MFHFFGKHDVLHVVVTVVRQVCGLFGNLKNRSTSTVSDPLHNFQPDPQEEVDSETKVIVVFLLQLGKV